MRPEAIDEFERALVIEAIHKRWRFDLSRYGQASLKRRFDRAVEVFGVSHVSELLHRILTDESFYIQFLSTVVVSVTEFFRDASFFQALRLTVLPVLATYPRPTIWHAGCATGQEVYSMATLLREAGILQRCQLYATDINRDALAVAKEGIYGLTELAEAAQAYRAAGGGGSFRSYYVRSQDSGSPAEHAVGIMSHDLRERIVWSTHNLCQDAAFTEAHLIVCRNTMIYFDRGLQDQVVDLFRRSLAPRGFLALGVKESLDFCAHNRAFTTVDAATRIYRARASQSQMHAVLP